MSIYGGRFFSRGSSTLTESIIVKRISYLIFINYETNLMSKNTSFVFTIVIKF